MNVKGTISKELRGYFSETTVHGFRYLVDGQSKCEKLVWAIIIFSGFIYSGYLIQQNIKHVELNPGKSELFPCH